MTNTLRACIEVDRLQVAYGDKVVLRDISFRVEPGEVVGYLGPNGAGKSTTMHVLTGQLQPTAGMVRVLGIDVARNPLDVRRKIAYVPEVAPLYEVLSALEFLELVGRLRGIDGDQVRNRAESLLDTLELGAVAHRPLRTYSRGMRQRVVFASAFLHESPLILLDEPLYGLDAQTVLMVKEIIRRLAESGKAVVYCSHLLDVVQQLATRVVILHQGEIVADGSPRLLREDSPDATLETVFRELTEDLDVEDRARRFLRVERS